MNKNLQHYKKNNKNLQPFLEQEPSTFLKAKIKTLNV
jgi:hypothetical protein